MKEIVNRLHESRQIELAKSILEANGYEITKVEEGTFSRVVSKIRKAIVDERDKNNRKLYNFIEKFKKEFGILSPIKNAGYGYTIEGDKEIRNYRCYIECSKEDTVQFFNDGKAYKGLKSEYAGRFTMNGSPDRKANYEMEDGEIQVEINYDVIYFDLHVVMSKEDGERDRAAQHSRVDKAYKDQ